MRQPPGPAALARNHCGLAREQLKPPNAAPIGHEIEVWTGRFRPRPLERSQAFDT